jgi:hypothetical protein
MPPWTTRPRNQQIAVWVAVRIAVPGRGAAEILEGNALWEHKTLLVLGGAPETWATGDVYWSFQVGSAPQPPQRGACHGHRPSPLWMRVRVT